jgi:large subunit ribosomal protein L4
MTTTTTKNKKAIVSLDAGVYSKDGKKVSDFSLPEEVFGLNWNADLVHQVITSLQTDARHPYAHAKTRGEVSGGGKKPWRQKGTGRARHGSTRSPIWVGGGVAHGPNKEKNFDRKVNKKTKNTAIKTIISKKHKDGEVLLLNELDFTTPKTTEMKKIMINLSKINDSMSKFATKKHNTALFITNAQDKNLYLSLRNFGNIETQSVADVNALILSKYKYLVFISPDSSIKTLTDRLNNNK